MPFQFHAEVKPFMYARGDRGGYHCENEQQPVSQIMIYHHHHHQPAARFGDSTSLFSCSVKEKLLLDNMMIKWSNHMGVE